MKRKNVYLFPRYWYHISSTLTETEITLTPRNGDQSFNRGPTEPEGERICVSPSIAHCLTAVPYCLVYDYVIYRTKKRIKAHRPYDVFDSNITLEGWIKVPTEFIRVGSIEFKVIKKYLNIKNIIDQAASEDDLVYSKKVFNWWN